MASLRKRPGSKIWQAQYYVPDPATGGLRQVRRSTGHTNKKKAMEAAVELERAAHGAVKAGSDDARRAKAVFEEAVREVERGTFNAPSARRYLARLLAIATGEEMPAFTVKSWFDEWLRRKERTSSKSTIARYRSHLKAFRKFLGDRAEKPLESITSADVRKWREELQDSGRAGKTVLGYTKDVGAAFRAAVREGLCNMNPVAALEALDVSDSLERKPFTLEEVGQLMEAAPDNEWRGAILTAAFTGLRLGDIARLRWDSIDLAGKSITLIPAKTKRKKKAVTIPIQADLLAFLEALPIHDDAPDAFIFPGLAEVPVNRRNGLSERFVAIMAEAGVSRGKPSRDAETRGKGRVTWERGFHSLRHTFTTWLRTAGVAEEDRMALTGHTTRDSHSIYSHADAEKLRDAIEKLPKLQS